MRQLPGVMADVAAGHGLPSDPDLTVWNARRCVLFTAWLRDTAFLMGSAQSTFGLLSDTSPLHGVTKMHVGVHQLSCRTEDSEGRLVVYRDSSVARL